VEFGRVSSGAWSANGDVSAERRESCVVDTTGRDFRTPLIGARRMRARSGPRERLPWCWIWFAWTVGHCGRSHQFWRAASRTAQLDRSVARSPPLLRSVDGYPPSTFDPADVRFSANRSARPSPPAPVTQPAQPPRRPPPTICTQPPWS